jgi:hypothetical protein
MSNSTGSRRTFGYFNDLGVEHIVQLDKSNAESADLGFAVPNSTNLPHAKQEGRIGTIMRKVNCYRILPNNEQVKRTFPVATMAKWQSLRAMGSPTVTVSGNTFFVTSFVGERQHILSILDTAQTDADPPAP